MKKFARKPASRRMKKTIFVAAEGRVTEFEYLNIIKEMMRDIAEYNVQYVPPQGNKTAPRNILNNMHKKLQKDTLFKDDQAWILIDRDDWKKEDIQALCDWAKRDERYFLSITNPCIEFWLLLHFESGIGAVNAEICNNNLKKYIKGYDKHIPPRIFTKEQIIDAVKQAESLDGKSWEVPCTTKMHLLVGTLLGL